MIRLGLVYWRYSYSIDRGISTIVYNTYIWGAVPILRVIYHDLGGNHPNW